MGPVPTGEPAQAFLFDLDGVLRREDSDEVAAIEARYGLPHGRLAEVAYERDRYGPAVLGEISDQEWRGRVLAALVPECGERAVDCVLDWGARMGRVDEEVAEVVAGVRAAGRPVGLVVNATDRLELELVALGLAERLDAIVSSARTGVALPDAAMYEIAAGILAVPVPRCVYVSRRAELVAGAERVGMTGHLFDSAAGLRAVVAEVSAG